jgi:formate dehydrogenase subunit gamma
MESSAPVRELVARHTGEIGGPVTALRTIVAEFGWIAAPHMQVVAEVFNLSVAEVRGIVSFYSDLRTSPPAQRQVRICQAEACQAVGGRALTRAAEQALGIRLGETAADGSVSLEPVYCLGVCASGPGATVNGRVVAAATVEELVG